MAIQRKYLVTGGTGFLGRALVAELLNDPANDVAAVGRNYGPPYRHKSLDPRCHYFFGDLASLADTMKAVDAVCPDVIFHLAANPNTKASTDDRLGMRAYEQNVRITHNLLACTLPETTFVFASSAAVYGDHCGIEGLQCFPTSAYGASKLAGEILVGVYRCQKKVNGKVARLVAQVGPNSTHGLVHDLIRKLRENPERLELLGERPGSCKPFMHTSDTARALIALATNDVCSEVNIGPRYSTNVESVAGVVAKDMGLSPKFVWLGKGSLWAGDNALVRIENAKMRQCLHFRYDHQTSLDAVAAAVKEAIRG